MDARNGWLAVALAATMALAVGCQSDGTTGPEEREGERERGQVSLSVAVPGGGGASLSGGPTGPHFDPVFEESNTLVITRVAVVLRKVELRRQVDDDCDPSGRDDACRKFLAGPMIVELPLDGEVKMVVTLEDVAPGVYDELRFEIHKPDDDTAEDLAFLQENPDFRRVSIRTEGTFDGRDFVFLTDLNEEQRMDLVPPLRAGEPPGTTNVTLHVDVGTWFRRPDGALVDPATANKGGDNENLVRDNIRRSIEAFEDRDRDGRRD